MLITNNVNFNTQKQKQVCVIYCVRCGLNSNCFEFDALTALYVYWFTGVRCCQIM